MTITSDSSFCRAALRAILAGLAVAGVLNTLGLAQHGDVRVSIPSEHVRACVPLDPPVALDPDQRVFAFRAPDGREYPAQAEPVVFSPDGRVRVVELSARCFSSSRYEVIDIAAPVADTRPAPLAWARQFGMKPPTISVDGAPLPLAYAGGAYRLGSARATLEFAGAHAFGWVTLLDGSDVALVDLVLHDADPGSQVWTFGAVTIGPGEVVTALPEPTVTGATLLDCGWMRQRGRREFRVALAPPGNAQARAEALDLLAGAGWGVSAAWGRVDAYGPQQLAVADLSHLTDLASRLRSDWSRAEYAVRNGLQWGVAVTYGSPGGTLGDYPVWGARYGGVTSGSGIDQRRGMDLALTGEPLGRLAYQLEHLAVTSRHAIGFYAPRGRPLDPAASSWQPSSVSAGEFVGQRQPFPPPSTSTPLDVYDAIDWQHYARRSKASQVLAWLDNDPVAKRELELSALLWCRAWNGAAIANGPAGIGAHLGRAHGWGLDLVASARATCGDESRRSVFDAWAVQSAAAYARAQMQNGIFQADTVSKNFKNSPFNSQHAIEQTIELGIGVNGLMGLRGSIGLDVDAQVVRAARDGVSRYLWNGSSTWQFAAVRSVATPPVVYDVIPAGLVKGSDSYQVGSALGYWRLLHPNDGAALAAINAYRAGVADPLKLSYSNVVSRNVEPMMLALQRFP
jgi:hypothetical protein